MKNTATILIGAAFDLVKIGGKVYDRSAMTKEQQINFNRNVAREICQIKGIK